MEYQRFILAGDSHGDVESIKRLVDYADRGSADIIFNGDLSGYPTKGDGLLNNLITFKESIDTFGSYKDGYTYIVPGSHELKRVWKNTEFPQNVIDVHKKSFSLKPRKIDADIIGYGGSRRAPGYIKFGEGFRRFVDINEINELFFYGKSKNKILLTHDAPFGYGDISWFKRLENGGIQALPPNSEGAEHSHGGDETLEIAIETLLPNLVVSGHFHGNPVAQKIGTKEKLKPGTYKKGIFINPGTLGRYDFQSDGGYFAEIEFLGSGEIRFLGHRNIKK